MKKVTIYSDGSSLGNPGNGGYGVVIKFENNLKELSGGFPNVTNNQMELLGAIEGLRALNEPCNVHLISDSQYVVRGINEWLNGWISKNWTGSNKKPVKNVEFWQDYVSVVETMGHVVTAEWVKGHNGHPENERCDYLARTAAEDLK